MYFFLKEVLYRIKEQNAGSRSKPVHAEGVEPFGPNKGIRIIDAGDESEADKGTVACFHPVANNAENTEIDNNIAPERPLFWAI